MTPFDDDDEIMLILSEVERRVGSLAAGQRELAIKAIRENANGVLDVARRTAANPAVKSKVAVFVTSIERGEHRLEAAPPPAAVPQRRRYPAPELTLEQVAHNRRIGGLMRRTVALGATEAVQAAMGSLTGFAALDAAEATLDELERAKRLQPAIADDDEELVW